MNEDEKTTAAPSTAETVEAPRTTVMDLTAGERETWLKDGTLPDSFKDVSTIVEDDGTLATVATDPKDSAPSGDKKDTTSADAASQDAAKTEPASETGDKTSVQDDRPKRRGAEQRTKQLDAQIAERLKQRREAQAELDRIDAQKAERAKEIERLDAEIAKRKTSPASPDTQATGDYAIKKSADGKPIRPRDADFKDMASYDAAMEQFYAAHEDYLESKVSRTLETKLAETRQKESEERARAESQTQLTEIAKSWKTRVEQTIERHDDYVDVYKSVAQEIAKAPAVDTFIVESDVGPELLYRLGTDYDDGGNLLADISKLSPSRAAIALGKLEDEIKSSLKPQQKKTEIPRVNRPTADVGGRNAAPADEAEAALDAGDFTRYKRILDERELALAKR